MRKHTKSAGGAPEVVAVTGAASWLGRLLVRALEADPRVQQVLAFDVEPKDVEGQTKTRFQRLDLTQPDATRELAGALRDGHAQALAHLSFLPRPTHNSEWAHELENVGTMFALTACAEAAVRKVVAVTSTMVYGAHPDNPNYLTEEHPPRGVRNSRYIADRIAVEQQLRTFALEHPEVTVTVMRPCATLGPGRQTLWSRYLSRPAAVTIFGYDPLMQLVDEADVVHALHRAVLEEHPGAYNVVGQGVLPLSRVVALAGRRRLPLPHAIARRVARTLWVAQVVDAPPSFLEYLRWTWVADGAKAERDMGFVPRFSTREALERFASGAQ